ncbi:MAG TPA: hypothetical protein VND93_28450 [Myxococcales bacterium]|nr:hypothetical protein [Myxococcales bacterium]
MQRKKWFIGGTVALAAVLAACGPAYEAYREYKEQQREKLIEAAWKAVRAGDDAMPTIPGALEGGDGDANLGPEEDDATLRRMAMEINIGPRTPQQSAELLRIAREEAARWNNPGGEEPQGQSPSVQGTRNWFNLGPASTRLAFNGTYYRAVDSGRATAIRMDPTQPNTIYLAVSGGGVWRADDFGSYPTWVPKTDSLGALAVGALELDPNNPGTLWIGLGDAFDQKFGAVVKSSDRGDTWGTPIQLSAATHPADGFSSASLEVRSLQIDPTNSSRILVATDDGFYMSTDGGSTFSIVDLPNTAGAPRRESTWSIAYLGTNGTDSSWAVSGVWACPTPAGAPAPTLPPTAGIGTNICATDNTQANWGDVWTSNDSGATWTSARLAGLFPAAVVGGTTPDLGRIELGAGAPAFGATTLYAQCENLREAASFNAAILKSTDSGATWTAVAINTARNTPANPPALLNPTTLTPDCNSLDVGHGQSWYNLSVVVDPTNPNRALFGGNLCGVRTMDGGATWENVSNWLPQGGNGFVANGFLPYVHADWHTSYATLWNGQLTVFAGTDGGLFMSQNVFSAATGTLVSWIFPDVGLSNHLMYSVATGDPVFGNESVVFGGLQDNGTRWRLIQDEAFIAEFNLQNWDQLIGGDGIGAAVSRTPLGHGKTYWASVQSSRRTCRPDKHDCGKATRIENGVEIANWRGTTAPAALRGGSTTTTADDDPEPFLMRYSPLYDANSSVISASTFQVWKVWQDASDQVFYTRVSPAPTGTNPGGLIAVGGVRQVRGQGPYASPFTYNINGTPSRVYGLPLTGGTSGLIVDTGTTLTFVPSATALNVSGQALATTQSVALPADPAHLGGTDIRQTWLVSISPLITNSGAPITPAIGHLFKTTDGGATWTPFHGNGTGFDLPNIPIYIVRFDPSDPSDQTIWAGTELGVYRSTDGGDTWARYGVGLPSVRVDDLQISSNGALVRVATYGRGIWEIRPHGEAATAASLGDWDGNGVIDYFDLAGLTVRMGATPDMTHDPWDPQYDYDNAFDLVPGGTPTALDEADLTALLAKFGSTP